MWYEMEGDYVLLRIRAVPASSKNVITGVLDGALKIKIKAPAVEGAANKELVKFLSKMFKIPKSDIRFVGGETSKQKRLRLPLNERVAAFIEKEKESS